MKQKLDILFIFQIIFAIMTIILAIYGLVTNNNSMQPIMFFLLSVMFGIIGFREYKRTRSKQTGMIYWVVSLFILITVFSLLFSS